MSGTQWKPKSWESFYRFLFIRKESRASRKVLCDLICSSLGTCTSSTVMSPTRRNRPRVFFRSIMARIPRDHLWRSQDRCSPGCASLQMPLRESDLHPLRDDGSQLLSRNPDSRIPLCFSIPSEASCTFSIEKLDGLRHQIIQKAGRLTRPAGTQPHDQRESCSSTRSAALP